MEKYNKEEILKFHNWNNNLFSIISTRNKNFKFTNGEFSLLGLFHNSKFIYRAYSILSSNYEDFIEFLSIKVEKGIFTNILKNVKYKDNIYVSKKTTGTLTLKNLLDGGENLWLFSTGTGISPFLSILKDFKTYEIYKKIILIHSVNLKNFLCYRYYLNNIFQKNIKILNYFNFIYYPIVTKENFISNDRITKIIENKNIFYNLGLKEELNNIKDRIMICGNIYMINDLKSIIEKKYKFFETKSDFLGNYVTEKAFLN